MRILILGGTTQASRLARALAWRADIAPTLSFAGRTEKPEAPPIPYRVGGFGDIDGLRAHLRSERIELVIDATHPFAANISANAEAACAAEATPLVVFTRAGWARRPDDHWIEVDGIEQAVVALGPEPRRVLLTQGRLQLAAFEAAPQHHYVIRTIDRPEDLSRLPRHRLILARGPFTLEDEMALMQSEAIEILVSKNSGGEATYAKIEAARRLGVPVVMLTRPASPSKPSFDDLDPLLAWIERHGAAP